MKLANLTTDSSAMHRRARCLNGPWRDWWPGALLLPGLELTGGAKPPTTAAGGRIAGGR